jgi:hypothetical protein
MIAQEKTHEQIMDERNSAIGVRFDDTYIWITLADERVLGVPLKWYPAIAEATLEQRQNYRFPSGLIMFPEIGDAIELEVILVAKYDL